ncbi:hypothetical protein [Heliothis virescens ascovirus 3e]|uniref:PARP-type domain-containing protein n=1 Tax=Heliothis virescens ascovirus 3e TaxID=260797 RepID=A4KXM8_HVAVE|nr:hypothetical protein HVAV3e_gp172 [Heliothis virescens ascovirus 3e]ABO37359.1 hypothetical protein [Heliothis virescens ascovirus 3e]
MPRKTRLVMLFNTSNVIVKIMNTTKQCNACHMHILKYTQGICVFLMFWCNSKIPIKWYHLDCFLSKHIPSADDPGADLFTNWFSINAHDRQEIRDICTAMKQPELNAVTEL